MQTKNPIVGIVGGRGILGRIFREAFEEIGWKVLISGRKPDGVKVLSTKALVKQADIIIVSVFLKDTKMVLEEITPLLKKNQLLCDFTSIKESPLEVMKQAKSEVVGLHPMFGDVESLQGKNIFVCRVKSGKLWGKLKKALEGFGLKLHEVSAKNHDELASLHQASSHLLSLAFALILKKKKVSPQKLFEIASPSTKLALLTSGRILAQDLEMYADIQMLNPRAKLVVVELAEILAKLACEIANEERKDLLKDFEVASKWFGNFDEFAMKESNRIFESLQGKEIEAKLGKTFSKNSIGILGENTQTEIASRKFLKRNKLNSPLAHFFTISEVFAKVMEGKIKFGFIPLENSSVGLVRETMLNLFEAKGKVKIFRESEMRVKHALIGKKKMNLKDVKQVFAHPQAIAQCANFLQKNLPRAEIVESANAGEALEKARKLPFTLAITSSEFAKDAKLVVVRDGIEDNKENQTRFIAIKKTSSNLKLKTENSKKTALAFFFTLNHAGMLANALAIFAKHRINLSRIESIPTTKKHGEFFFFTECEKNLNLPKAIKELEKSAKVLNLGSY